MAHSDEASVAQRVVLRPHRSRVVCWLLAPAVLLAFALLGTGLSGPTGSGTGVFQPSDRYAMIGLGVLGAVAILAFTRPRVIADRTGIKIRNVVGGYDLPWQMVRAVRFERGQPWASLELHDDDVVAMMAIQAADKRHAVTGVRALRGLLAAHVAQAAAASDTPADRRPQASPGPDLLA